MRPPKRRRDRPPARPARPTPADVRADEIAAESAHAAGKTAERDGVGRNGRRQPDVADAASRPKIGYRPGTGDVIVGAGGARQRRRGLRDGQVVERIGGRRV